MPEVSRKKKSDVPEIFPEFLVDVRVAGSDNGEMTVNEAKDLLGWEEEPETGKKFGEKYDLLDMNKKKIRLNRGQGIPFNREHALEFSQEVLNKRMKLTGCYEIGKCGVVHSGRHRWVGLILADQIRNGPQKPHWDGVWDNEPLTVPCIIHYGVEDDDDTVNSIDTLTHARDVVDMIFRSDLWKSKGKKEKLELAKCLDWAIRVVWERTGAKHDPWAPRKTHSEIMDFVSRHKRILKCVEHIYAENGDGGINTIVKAGIAAGYLYLMEASATDPKLYGSIDPSQRKEAGKNGIDFANTEKADQFWIDVHSSKKLLCVNEKMAAIVRDQAEGKTLGGNTKERLAVVLRAWNLYSRNKKVSLEDLDISEGYQTTEDGKLTFLDSTIVGGIDFGYSGKIESEEEEIEETPEAEPVPSAAETTEDPKKAARKDKAKKIVEKRKKKNVEPTISGGDEYVRKEESPEEEIEPTIEDLVDTEEGEDEE